MAGRNPLHDGRSGTQRMSETPKQPPTPPKPSPPTWLDKAKGGALEFAKGNALFLGLLLLTIVGSIMVVVRTRPPMALNPPPEGAGPGEDGGLSVFGTAKVVFIACGAYVFVWFVLRTWFKEKGGPSPPPPPPPSSGPRTAPVASGSGSLNLDRGSGFAGSHYR